jgi:hypothetical protein
MQKNNLCFDLLLIWAIIIVCVGCIAFLSVIVDRKFWLTQKQLQDAINYYIEAKENYKKAEKKIVDYILNDKK